MMDQKFTSLTTLGCAALAILAPLSATAKSPHSISVTPVSTVAAGSFLTSAAEIVAHDPVTQRVFVVNAQAARIDVFNIANPAQPLIVGSIDATAFGGIANSVAVHDGAVAVAVESTVKTNPGKVVFFNTNLQFLGEVTVGALPDMVTFTPNGRYVLTADEGEPSDDYTVDPEGTVSIIDVSKGVALVTQADVRTVDFRAYNSKSRAELFNGDGTGPKPAIRVFGPNATVAQDLEPEYITVSHDSKTAWVTLQEGNAIGIIDINTGAVTDLVGLGTKDHSLASNGFGSSNALDASDRDGIPVANNGRINIQNWPVKGLYLPDGIDSYKVGNQTYLVLANEGDSREWSGYAEETRVGSMALDPTVFPPAVATELKKNNNLGRLKATKAQGDTNGNNLYREIYTFGARSFSIRDAQGNLVWDSGDQFERILAQVLPNFFNSNHEINKFDDRSDDKGPEPECVTLGKAFGRTYAFVGLERVSGVMIFDITDPTAPEFVQYADNRDFTQPTNTAAAGDLGPEGLFFISEENSPNGKPLLLVANEVSGTTTVYEINKVKGNK